MGGRGPRPDRSGLQTERGRHWTGPRGAGRRGGARFVLFGCEGISTRLLERTVGWGLCLGRRRLGGSEAARAARGHSDVPRRGGGEGVCPAAVARLDGGRK